MKELTIKQKEILNAIKQFIAKNNYPPTIRELANILDISSTNTIHFHLQQLIEKKYITKGRKSRDIKLLVPNEFLKESNTIIEVALFHDTDKDLTSPKTFFPLLTSLYHNNTNLFVVQITNQNMTDFGIYDNDYLIIEKKITANDDDIIAIKPKNEKILIRKYTKKEDMNIFQSNDNKISILSNFIILGKVIGIYRNL